jgi:hypothetical protein
MDDRPGGHWHQQDAEPEFVGQRQDGPKFGWVTRLAASPSQD